MERFLRMMFDVELAKSGRGWEWRVNNSSGKIIMHGREAKRLNARYQAERALFLLLMATGARELDREDKV
jgi:hypothetical protein